MALPTTTDTSADVARRQQQQLLAMTPAGRGKLLAALCDGVTELAVAGIRREIPGATPSEVRRHLMIRRYGANFVESLPPEFQ